MIAIDSMRNVGEKLRGVVMFERFTASVIFAISAMLPLLIVGLVLGVNIWGNSMAMMLYLFSPALCAFISAYFLSLKICFNPEKYTSGLLYSLAISIVIVIVSLILWMIPAAILFQPDELIAAPLVVFYAGTLFGWAVYPPGLIAGYVVWLISRRKAKNQPD